MNKNINKLDEVFDKCRIFITVGICGAGKTYYSKIIMNENPNLNIQIIYLDDIIALKMDNHVIEKYVEILLNNNHNVIIDSVVSLEDRKKWVNISKSFGVDIGCLYFDTSIDICFKRNYKRYPRIKKDAIRVMKKEFIIPTIEEGFNVIYDVNNNVIID